MRLKREREYHQNDARDHHTYASDKSIESRSKQSAYRSIVFSVSRPRPKLLINVGLLEYPTCTEFGQLLIVISGKDTPMKSIDSILILIKRMVQLLI